MPDQQKNNNAPQYLIVGKTLKPHGVHGALKVEPITENPDRFKTLSVIYIGDDTLPKKCYELEQVEFTPKHLVVYLKDVDTRNKAEEFRGTFLYITKEQAVDLPEGAYFYYELVGMKVQDEDHNFIGTVKDVVDYPAQRLFILDVDDNDVLIPDVDEIVKDIDSQKQTITIHLIEGLLE